MSCLGQRKSQEAADDRQYAEDDERQLAPYASTGFRLGQIVDVRVQDAAEPTGERTEPGSRVPTGTSTVHFAITFTALQR